MENINYFETIDGSLKADEPYDRGRFSLTLYNETLEIKLHDDAGAEKSITIKQAKSLHSLLGNLLDEVERIK